MGALAASDAALVTLRIRPGEPGDEARLQDIERLAGQRFRQIGMDQIADDDPPPLEQLAGCVRDGRCWVAEADEGELVGYLIVEEVDGNAHIEQVSVVPVRQGAGVGRRLIDAALDWARIGGRPALTITTFTDVPWNRPLYEHLGFRVLDEQEIGPGLRELREVEARHGLDPDIRVCMRLDVGD